MFEIHPPPRRIVLSQPAGPLPDSIERRVEKQWQAAREEPGVLYNGSLVTVVEVSADRVVVQPSEYRLLVAARRDPELRRSLGVRPLAVSGLVRVGEGVVIGRRGADVRYEPGVWELVPSGGVEPTDLCGTELDVQARLLAELEEEIHVPPSRVASVEAFALVHDTGEDLFDLALEVVLEVEPRELLSGFSRGSDEARGTGSDSGWEYSAIEVVPLSDLRSWSEGRSLLPVSRVLLENRGLLGR